jgi:hypothetical protein
MPKAEEPMRAHLLTIAGYVFSTLLVQATSHFVINKAHYAAIPFVRAEPIVALGVLTMLVQGAILSYAYSVSRLKDGGLFGALLTAWMFGAFLASYMSLALPAEYAAPSIPAWFGVEATAAALQFTLAGVFLWLAHRRLAALRTA